MTVALCMFALWAWGGWISWKGIENGNGWIGAILSEKIRKSLNKKENGGKRRQGRGTRAGKAFRN